MKLLNKYPGGIFLETRPIKDFERLMLDLIGQEGFKKIFGKDIDFQSIESVYNWDSFLENEYDLILPAYAILNNEQKQGYMRIEHEKQLQVCKPYKMDPGNLVFKHELECLYHLFSYLPMDQEVDKEIKRLVF